METVRIYPLPTLRRGYARRLREARLEAARVWTRCRDLHLAARTAHTRWPREADLQAATRGPFALHSQTVQMIFHTFLANIDSTRELRKTNRTIRYPYKDKRYYPAALACPGGESGTRTHRLADGTRTPFARIQAGPARAHGGLQARLEGRL